MKITDIKLQEKRRDRYSIYVDGKYSFGLSQWQLADSKLKIGQRLTKTELDRLKRDSTFGKLYERTLKWLAIRPRSRWEVDTYINRITNKDEIYREIFSRLENSNHINDLAFASAWIENRRLTKPVSKRRLVQELRAKRVDDEIINQVISRDQTDNLAIIKELIEKKRRISRYQSDDKLMAYLTRQGFDYGDIKTVLNKLSD